MANRLTKKEKGFVKDYLDTGNATIATLKNYDTTNKAVAASIGSENLTKQKVQDALQGASQMAVSVVVKLAQSAENETVQLGAAKDILDRSGHKPVEKNLNVNVEAQTIPDEDLEDLAKRLELLGDKRTNISSDGTQTVIMGREVSDQNGDGSKS